jgi:hypothetical protein
VKLAAGVIAYLVCAMAFFVVWWKRMPVVEFDDGERKVVGWTDYTAPYHATDEYVSRRVSYDPVLSFLLSLVLWWALVMMIGVRTVVIAAFDVITYIPFKLTGNACGLATRTWKHNSTVYSKVAHRYMDDREQAEIQRLTRMESAVIIQPTAFPRSERR